MGCEWVDVQRLGLGISPVKLIARMFVGMIDHYRVLYNFRNVSLHHQRLVLQ